MGTAQTEHQTEVPWEELGEITGAVDADELLAGATLDEDRTDEEGN